MLPVNGSRSVCVDWHLGHGGVVSADSGIRGTPGRLKVTFECAAPEGDRQLGISLSHAKAC